ncbi:MAG: Coenzyme F420 hydrogenase/dehydrogenase, beta subunit C-terminal domain [Acidaminococcaceae bacterium]|nr:Coenzyme F420 hydrogenase/dehydrogenase, beta subunit C-terminal domain [Acidaminococcaceae bacterium]
MIDKKAKQDCSGCSACASVCPKNCIEMRADEQGFRYPHVNYEECVHCGLCDQVCEKAAKGVVSETIPKGYGACANDQKLRFGSSSGGIFTLLAEKVLEENGIVVGAAFSDDFRSVRHVVVDSPNGLAALRGSKYLQSNIGDSFKKVKEYLQNGRNVLFSGTPCQVAGLKAYLKKDYENLLCVDIVCHGVPSAGVWAKYCNEIENGLGGKIDKVNFRHKKFGWADYAVSVSLKGGKDLFLFKNEDPYIRLFLNDYSLRPSCYHCNHKGINRKSDITLADFWDVKKLLPEVSDGKGTSLLLVHSEKGLRYVKAISELVNIKEVDTIQAVNHNLSTIQSARRPSEADSFWKDFESLTIDNLAQKYVPISTRKRIKLMIKKTLFLVF